LVKHIKPHALLEVTIPWSSIDYFGYERRRKKKNRRKNENEMSKSGCFSKREHN
jgi:hypothetical protein